MDSGKSYDIVHGTSVAGTFDSGNNFTSAENNKYGRIVYGAIEGHDIFRRWLINQDFTSTTWGKAHDLLCDYWSPEFVKTMEKALDDMERKN